MRRKLITALQSSYSPEKGRKIERATVLSKANICCREKREMLKTTYLTTQTRDKSARSRLHVKYDHREKEGGRK